MRKEGLHRAAARLCSTQQLDLRGSDPGADIELDLDMGGCEGPCARKASTEQPPPASAEAELKLYLVADLEDPSPPPSSHPGDRSGWI